MEQVLLFGEASPEILLLLRARVKRSDLFGSRGKPTRTSVHVSTLWLRIWSKGHRFLTDVAFDCSCATNEPLLLWHPFPQVLLPFH